MADLTLTYCAAVDIEALTQVSAYSTTTAPTLADVTLFAQARAGTVYSWIRASAGASAPGPAAFATTIDTSTDAGKGLDKVAREANAVMAAVDALESAGIGDEPNQSDRIQRMRERFERSDPEVASPMEMGVMAAAAQLVDSTMSSTHISSGDKTAAVVTPILEEDGLSFSGATEW